MAHLHEPTGRTVAFVIGLLLVAVVRDTACETFQFPEFVAIEGGDDGAVCGGWIIDKVLRPHVLTTDACVQQRGSLRQLLVRYGSAEVTSRTASLAVDQKLTYDDQDQLIVLSTFGRLRRNPIPASPEQTHRHNGTYILCWRRPVQSGEAALHKTLLRVESGQHRSVTEMLNTLYCDSLNGYLLEGAMLLDNLTPSAMVTLVRDSVFSSCGTKVELLELRNLTHPANLAQRMIDSPLVEPVPDNRFTLTEPNSAFGYIVYVIFMGYCILYTVMFFIFGLMRTHPSTDL
uniref:Peptidase S1 domain-containing protein n=1 Tax=Anopheles maculatus TaxID=74869 RepID=A0A182SID2_9DIPT